jgi:alcohol dehydrogenase YqhD (iron-dependent ADH family)
MPFPACNVNSAELLNNLYGADKDKLKQNLSRLYKLSTMSPKERAEIQKGIDTARNFFNALAHSPAQKILDQLELKLQRE